MPFTDHERCVVPQRQQPDTQPVQDVDHARHARKLAERDHALPVVIHEALVVDETDVLRMTRGRWGQIEGSLLVCVDRST